MALDHELSRIVSFILIMLHFSNHHVLCWSGSSLLCAILLKV